MAENLSVFCAKDVSFKSEMIPIDNRVSLKLIIFTPPAKNNNPAIVFIPGWISLIDGWSDVLQEMTKDFTVYYLETREKISSQISGNADISVEAIGKDIVNLISKLNLKTNEYILFGSSLGASAILDCAYFLNEKPLCLVLIGPNAVIKIPRFGIFLLNLFYPPLYNFCKPYVKWYLKNFRLNTKDDNEQYLKYCNTLDAADPWKLKKAALALSKYSVWNSLSSINIPSLLIGASKDKIHEPGNLRKIVSMLKHSTNTDLGTNKETHSKKVVEEMRKYLAGL